MPQPLPTSFYYGIRKFYILFYDIYYTNLPLIGGLFLLVSGILRTNFCLQSFPPVRFKFLYFADNIDIPLSVLVGPVSKSTPIIWTRQLPFILTLLANHLMISRHYHSNLQRRRVLAGVVELVCYRQLVIHHLVPS
jgi:hypothetical protein